MLCIARTTLSQDVCLFVCLSQAGTYVETAKHSMKLFSPLGSNTILVFFLYKRYGNIPTIAAIFTSHTLDAPNGSFHCRGYEKNRFCDQYLASSRKWHTIRP